MTGSHPNIVLRVGGATLFEPTGMLPLVMPIVERYSFANVWMLFGGGDTIESMRTLHRVYPELDEIEMHWRCIRLLDATFEIACELIPMAIRVQTWEDLAHERLLTGKRLRIVRTTSFYSPDALENLPRSWIPQCGWETTTDALAWLLAKLVRADSLVLLKRCECPDNMTLQEAMRAGVIDQELCRLASNDQDRQKPCIEIASLFKPQRGNSL